MSEMLVECKNLKKYFRVPAGYLHAVDDISFNLMEGETLGVVGESGCGKSTLGRTVLGLLPSSGGQLILDGQDISNMSRKEMKHLRKKMQIIFQDPFSCLDSKMTIFAIIEEPLLIHKVCKNKEERSKKIKELMNLVGLDERYINAYPHELDGGRRQRVGIARALALNPKFIVCDEPVSALDVSIQAQILNLMSDLKERLHLTYMFITHDLSVVKHISDKIMVLYMGKMVEYATADELFEHPMHPYTKALLSAIPVPDISSRTREPEIIQGEVASPINPKPGCRFANRCRYAIAECSMKEPEMTLQGEEHYVACHIVSQQKGEENE